MTGQRIAPGGLRDTSVLAWLIAHGGARQARTEPMKLFLTLGRHRPLFRGWLRFAGRLMPGGKLPRRETELVILRVAHLRECAYEREHHLRIGRAAGLTDADLARVVDGPDAAGWSLREQAILAAVDQLVGTGDLDDATWNALHAQLSDTECIEVLLLAGHYQMLASTITALRIEPDRSRR